MVILNTVLVGFYLVDSARADSISLVPSLRLGEQWDSNPFLIEEGGEINSDFVTEISPQIAVRSIAIRNQYSASYRLDLRRYSRFRGLDYIGHAADISTDLELSQSTSLSLGDTYVFTPESREASTAGIQTVRNGIRSNNAFAMTQRTFSNGSSVSLRLENAIADYEDESLFDTRTDSASLSGSYTYSSNTALTMSYVYRKDLYRTVTDGESFTETHSAQLGISNQLSADSSISVSGGLVYADNFDKAATWLASVGYAKEFQETSFNMNFLRSITNTSGFTSEISILDSGSMTLSHTFGRSFSANVGGSLSKNRSEPSGIVDITYYTADAGIVWRPLEWLAFDARYSHFQQWVEDALGYNLSRDQVFIGFTATQNELRF